MTIENYKDMADEIERLEVLLQGLALTTLPDRLQIQNFKQVLPDVINQMKKILIKENGDIWNVQTESSENKKNTT